jgi:hypothetical protein
MSFENIPIIKNNIDYDDLLNKMNLVYQNGQLYRASQNIAQDKHSVETVNTNLKNIDKRGIYNKYFNTVEVEKPKTKIEYYEFSPQETSLLTKIDSFPKIIAYPLFITKFFISLSVKVFNLNLIKLCLCSGKY